VRLVVDTGVFSAALSRRRRAELDPLVARLPGNQVYLAVQTVAELRFGALAAHWGEARRSRLEAAIHGTTVVPVSDALVHAVAQLRHACRTAGHPLAAGEHHADLWIAATAMHIGDRLVSADRVFRDVPELELA
jgi:predicted nucleic acid-binding protein